MRALLCMPSGQHVPNLLSVHHLAPDRLVLLVTPKMKRAAEDLLAALAHGKLDYSQRCDVLPLSNEDDIAGIRRPLQQIHQEHPDWEWIVNLTGGTKPMSIAAYEFFKEVGARLIYVNADRPDALLGLDGRPGEICAYRPSVQEFLAGYGVSFNKSIAKIVEAEGRGRQLRDCARVIARYAAGEDLLRLEEEERKQARRKGLVVAGGRIPALHDEVRAALVRSFGLRSEDGWLAGELDRHAVEFLTGGWLEVFFFCLLDQHAGALGLWDVRLGIEPCKGSASNEMDVAFMRGHALHMVECKSGEQEHDPGTDVLYKVEAVLRQFRALRVRSYLATTASNVLDPKTGQVKSTLANRASVYDCRIITRQEIQRLGGEAEDPEVLRSILGFREAGS